MRIQTSISSLLVVTVLTAACGGQAVREHAGAGKTSAEPLVWPKPPRSARVRFIGAVARPADLGIKPSFWKRLGKLLHGAEPDWFIRPGGVAALGNKIYVADPGAQALWVLDTQQGRFQRVQKAGRQRLVSPVAVTPGRNGSVYLADSYLAKVFVYQADGTLHLIVSDKKLQRPAGLAYDAAKDRLYVADSAAHRIRIFDGQGKPVGALGGRGTAKGRFNFPTHVAVDRKGMLYVTDAMGFRIQMFGPDGGFLSTFGRHGNASGDFAAPKGVASDSAGHVYVVDALFDAVQIFDRSGRLLLSFGERGLGPAQFWLPGGLYIDEQDRIYVADAYNQRIQIFEYLGGGGDD